MSIASNPEETASKPPVVAQPIDPELDAADSSERPTSCVGSMCGCINYSFNPIVFLASTLVIWGFVVWCLLDPNSATSITNLQTWLVVNFSWLYIGAVFCFMVFMIYLLLHPTYSQIKLGKPNEQPRYNMVAWFSMLFSAGYGIGMYFYGVAETVLHFRDAVEGANRYSYLPRQLQAVAGLNLSWFHGGFAGLAVYCVIGLTIGFLSHRHDFPLTMRTCFYPLIGKKIYGILGDIIDTAAVIATMFGLATSLGLGVMQINAGMHRVFGSGVPNTSNSQIFIIWIITVLATISVVTGVDKGIKILSQLNFGFGMILLLYLLFVGDTFFVFNLFVETFGFHFQTLMGTFTDTDAFEQAGFEGDSNPRAWMSWWTVFYWGWWIAWSPFVGTFIAQISRGYTVRVFILGNMLVPALVTAIWTTIMGGLGVKEEYHALERNIGNGCYYNYNYNGTITDGTYTRLSCANVEDQLFLLIESFPLSQFISIITIVAIIGYFVTSSDSASYVIDLITANGIEEPPKMQRIFWALTEGAVATALLAVGGEDALQALQTVSIAAALPFTFLLIIMAFGLVRAFKMDDELFARGRLIVSHKKQANGDHRDEHQFMQVKPNDGDAEHEMEEKHNGENEKESRNGQLDCDDDEVKEWRSGLFDALFSSLLMCLKGVFVPCWLQFRNGRKIGMYGGKQHSVFTNALWILSVFVPPVLFVVLHICEVVKPGLAYLAWVVFVYFVCNGVVHRMQIREHYHLKGNAVTDIVAYGCCYCFAASQESLQCEPSVLL